MRALRVLTIVAAFWAGTVLADQVLVAVRVHRVRRVLQLLEQERDDALAGIEAQL